MDLEMVRGVYAIALKILSAFLTFLMFVAISWQMDREQFGLFSVLFSGVTLIGTLAALGQPLVMLRSIDRQSAKNVNLILKSRNLTIYSSITFAIFGVILAFIFSDKIDRPTLLLASVLVIPFAYTEYLSHLLRAWGRISAAMVPKDIAWRLIVILGVSTFGYIGGFDAMVAIGLCFISLIAVSIFQHILAFENSQLVATADNEGPSYRDLALGSLVLCLTSTFVLVSQNLSTIALSALVSLEDVGPFFAAAKASALLALPLVGSLSYFAPRIAAAYRQESREKLLAAVRKTAVLATIPALIGWLLYVAAGHWVLMLFGAGFDSAYPALLILGFSFVIDAAFGPTGSLMTMTGHEKLYLTFLIIANLAGFALAFFAVQYWGIIGAAYGILATTVLQNGLVCWWSIRKLDINPSILSLIRRP